MSWQTIMKWVPTQRFILIQENTAVNNPVVPPYLYDVIYPKFGEYFSAKAANSIQPCIIPGILMINSIPDMDRAM